MAGGTYSFEYDELGAQTQVKVGDQVLSTNEYAPDRSHKLMSTTFANGGALNNKYDDFDRIVAVSYDDADPATDPRYSYEFGANGQVAHLKDHHLNRTQWTEYDLADRPIRASTRDDGTNALLYQTVLKYDKCNRLKKFREDAGASSYLTQYTYDNDNRTTKIIYGKAETENRHLTYSYDGPGRVSSQTLTNGAGNAIQTSYTFVVGDAEAHGTGASTPLVETLTHKRGTADLLKLQYEYDATGNIQTEARTEKVGTATTTKTTEYGYDPLGQLVRVDDPRENASWAYKYDQGGNIQSKTKYAYTTDDLYDRTPAESISYQYNNGWKDRLDYYGSKWISYDEIGNPTSYDNWTYDWQAWRQLNKMTQWSTTTDRPNVYGKVKVNEATMVASHERGISDAGHTLSMANMELKADAAGYKLVSGELIADYEQSGTKQQVIEFKYDPNGLRTQKKVSQLNASGAVTSSLTTDYILHGKLLMELRQGADNLHFFYDAQSRPIMVKYGTNYYTYLQNLQGDILAIVDSTGAKVVEYKYDAWGRHVGATVTQSTIATPIGTATKLAALNPFRYRGYLYDEETRLYYLRSRYYNPEWGRFINADCLLGDTGGLLSHNLFTYALNNPTCFADEDGTFAFFPSDGTCGCGYWGRCRRSGCC